MIKKMGNKWVLFNKAGTKKLGTHPSRAAAVAQEQAIEIAKHKRKK
jgi:hypothetical protein